MATTIRSGAEAHAGYYAESGDLIGSACRFKGTVTTVEKDRYSLKLSDGSIRRFVRAHVHHVDDCPNRR